MGIGMMLKIESQPTLDLSLGTSKSYYKLYINIINRYKCANSNDDVFSFYFALFT